MFFSELRKLLSGRFLIIMVAFVIINCIICYIQIDSMSFSVDDVEYYMNLYENDIDSFMGKYINEYIDDLNFEQKNVEYNCLNMVVESYNYTQQLYDDFDSIIFKSKVNMSELPANSYMYRYQNQVLSTYTKLATKDFSPTYICGWDCFFDYKFQEILSVMFILLVASYLVIHENDCNVDVILHTGVRGRTQLILTKILSLFCISFTISIILTVSSLLIIKLKLGLYGLVEPIQMISKYRLFPHYITIREMLILKTIVASVSIFILGLISSIFAKLTKSNVFAIILSGSILVISYVITVINNTSILSKLNLYTILFFPESFNKYLSVNILSYSINLLLIICIVLVVLIVLGIFSLCSMYDKNIQIHIKCKNIADTHLSIYSGMGMFKSECKKFSLNKPCCIVVVVLLLLESILIYHSCNNINDDVYLGYIQSFEGEFTYEKKEEIKNIRETFDQIIASRENIVESYRQGQINDQEYRDFMRKYWDAYMTEAEFARVEDFCEYLMDLDKTGIKGNFIYDTGYKILFSSEYDILLCIIIYVLTSNVFYEEIHTGMRHILITTVKGRKALLKNKILFSIFISVITTVIVSLIKLLIISHKIPLLNWMDPLISLQGFKNIDSEISIISFYLLCIGFKCIVSAMVGCLFAIIGGMVPKIQISFVVCSFIMWFPALIGQYIPVIRCIDTAALLSVSTAIEFYMLYTNVNVFLCLLFQLILSLPITAILIHFFYIKNIQKNNYKREFFI